MNLLHLGGIFSERMFLIYHVSMVLLRTYFIAPITLFLIHVVPNETLFHLKDTP